MLRMAAIYLAVGAWATYVGIKNRDPFPLVAALAHVVGLVLMVRTPRAPIAPRPSNLDVRGGRLWIDGQLVQPTRITQTDTPRGPGVVFERREGTLLVDCRDKEARRELLEALDAPRPVAWSFGYVLPITVRMVQLALFVVLGGIALRVLGQTWIGFRWAWGLSLASIGAGLAGRLEVTKDHLVLRGLTERVIPLKSVAHVRVADDPRRPNAIDVDAMGVIMRLTMIDAGPYDVVRLLERKLHRARE
jgi:ribosomal protein L24E